MLSFLLALALGVTTLIPMNDTAANAQEYPTTLPQFEYCLELNNWQFSTDTEFTYTCGSTFDAIRRTTSRVFVHPIFFHHGATSDTSGFPIFVLKTMDKKLTKQMEGTYFSEDCNRDQRLAMACSMIFTSCYYNATLDKYVLPPLCKESCIYTSGCTGTTEDDCETLPSYDIENPGNCVMQSDMVFFAADIWTTTTITSASPIVAASALAMII